MILDLILAVLALAALLAIPLIIIGAISESIPDIRWDRPQATYKRGKQ